MTRIWLQLCFSFLVAVTAGCAYNGTASGDSSATHSDPKLVRLDAIEVLDKGDADGKAVILDRIDAWSTDCNGQSTIWLKDSDVPLVNGDRIPGTDYIFVGIEENEDRTTFLLRHIDNG